MDDKEIEKQLEELKNSSELLKHIIEEEIKAAKNKLMSDKDAKESALRFAKSVKDANTMFKRDSDAISSSMKLLKESYDKHELTVEDVESQLQRLRSEINRTSDQNAKQRLINQKAELENIVIRKKVSDNLKETLGEQLTSGISVAFKGFVEAGKQAMSSGDGIQTAGSLMKTGIDIANNSVQVGANSLKDLGGQMAGMGGKAKLAGVGLSLLGSAVGGLSNGMSELAKAGIDMLIKAVTKSIDTYRAMSQSGALFANGIEGMRTSASNAGMSLDDFSKVAATNKDVFAKLGLGVSGGMQKMSGAMKAGGEDMRKQLFALGYSMEDQGNLMAQTMANMADPTGKLKASNEQVAAATKKYAQDLSMLAALTGEDMKAKQDKIKQENMELAVQQKLAKMTPEDRQKFIAMQNSLDETQRRQLKERMVYGTVISSDLAIMEATTSGMKEQGDALFQATKDGTMSAEKGAAIRAQYDQKIAQSALAQGEIGVAAMADANSSVAAAAKGMSQKISEGNKFTEEGIKETQKTLEERKRQAAKDPMVAVQEQQRAFGVEMDLLTTKHMPKFADALGETMKLTKDALTKFANYASGLAEEPSWTMKLAGIATGLLTVIPTLVQLFLAFKKPGGGGPDLGDMLDKGGKGGPSGPEGKPKGRFGRAFDAVKNFGGRLLGLAPAAEAAAATAAAPAATAATTTAAGATSVLGKGASMALRAAKFLGPAAIAATAGYDAYKGYQNAGANFDLKPGKEATTGQKLSSAAGSVLSGLSFGLLDEKSMAQGVHGAGSSIGNFFSKTASGIGNVVSGGANLIGSGVSALAGKAGLGSGYTPTGGIDPKVMLDMQKATTDKMDVSFKDFNATLKDNSKTSTDIADLLRTQLTKQDEIIAALKESLDVSQRLLTHAQG